MGAQELLILGVVGFVLFGANKLPQLARSLGSSVVEFKKALKSDDDGAALAPQDSADRRTAAPSSSETSVS